MHTVNAADIRLMQCEMHACWAIMGPSGALNLIPYHACTIMSNNMTSSQRISQSCLGISPLHTCSHTTSTNIFSIPWAGATVNVGVDPSKVLVTKLKIDKDRKALLERKSAKGADKGKGKFTESEVTAMSNVD